MYWSSLLEVFVFCSASDFCTVSCMKTFSSFRTQTNLMSRMTDVSSPNIPHKRALICRLFAEANGITTINALLAC